jgi:hypothetical protein
LLLAVIDLLSARFVVVLPTPVPVSATFSGLFVALLVTVRFPVYDCAAVGANVTDTVHEAPAAIDEPQVLVCANPDGTATDETAAAALPVLLTVTECALLSEPTVSLPNDTDDGLADRVALCVVPPEAGKISNSEICAALHPVFPVMLSCRYW